MKQAQLEKQIRNKSADQGKNRQRTLQVLLFFLLLGAAGFFAASLWMVRPAPKGEAISASSPQADRLVNKHLFLTSQEQHLRQKKIQIENSYMAPELGDSIWPKTSTIKEVGVDHSPDRNEKTAFDDLQRYRKELRYTNPDQVIQGEIRDQDLRTKDELDYREEYAQQFIENARRNGYIVKLNEDFVVVQVSPIGGAAH